jgi:hypothetical protein
MATWNTSDFAIFARSIGDMSTTKDQLGQEDTDTSTHRHCHIQTEKCMPILMKVTNEYIGTHPPSSLLSTQRSWGVGGVGGVSHYTAQEIQTCTPQIGTLYVCIESLLTLGTLSLRSAHLGASALLAPSYSQFSSLAVQGEIPTRRNAQQCEALRFNASHKHTS